MSEHFMHLQEELARSSDRVTVQTPFGPVTGKRALNGAAVFLEVPSALPPRRFEAAEPLTSDFRYEQKDYVLESSYAAQPDNDGQSKKLDAADVLWLGKPTENPLFVNIVIPPSFPNETNFPVKVYIHGGSLQFGSPHGLSSQAQYISAERSQIWVNIGYRLSAFGFLACDEPKVDGNFGFKDQWLTLLWIRDNIKAFGGNPDDIQLTGLSAGAHSVHQQLHHASHLPEGENCPFQSAILQSNAIVTAPRTPAELRPQFQALCRALKLDPDDPNVLSTLRDPAQVPWSEITRVIDEDALGIQWGTFRGCLEDSWLPTSPDPMAWQKSGDFARALKAKGVRSIVMGDLKDEWLVYSYSHPVSSMRDIELNMERYYQKEVVRNIMSLYTSLPDGAAQDDFEQLLGEMLSEGQVHLPVRLLARDLWAAGFPFVRYEIQWTPEQVRPLGYVTHGTDRPLWAFYLPILEEQAETASAWLDAIAAEVWEVEKRGNRRELTEILTLMEEKTISWTRDAKWDKLMPLLAALHGQDPI